jgi:hypothetical protein
MADRPLQGATVVPFLFLWNWLKPLQGPAAVSRRRHRRHDRTLRGRFLARLEALEDHTVPSTLMVTSNLDTGVAGDALENTGALTVSGSTFT